MKEKPRRRRRNRPTRASRPDPDADPDPDAPDDDLQARGYRSMDEVCGLGGVVDSLERITQTVFAERCDLR